MAAAQPFALGGFVALGDAPNGILAWGALVPLWLAAREASPRRAFALGWVFGAVYFVATIFWVYVAMNRFGGLNAPVSAALTVGLCALLACFPAAAIAFARWLDVRGAVRGAVALPFAWAASEWIRNFALTGFPWSNLAHSQWKALLVAQSADVAGIYGIVALLVAVNVALAELHVSFWRSPAAAPGAARYARVAAGAVLVTLVYGAFRIAAVDTAVGDARTLPVALVQGNISQDQKHRADFRDRVRAIYAEEQRRAEARGAKLVVWPEAAIPGAVHVRSERVPDRELQHPNTSWILAGAASYWHEGETLMAQNSALLVAPGKQIADRYHKSHLVPFGEYVPMKRLLFFARKLTHAAGNFLPGSEEEIAPLSLPLDDGGRARFGVLICYEDIFPEVARLETARGAEFLVNVTNDAWYGRTSAPFQHVAMTVFRAIESRRAVVRSAQTGVSAFVDPAGRVRARTGIFEGPLTLHVDVPLGGPASFYVRYGDVFAAGCCGFLLVAAAVAMRPVRVPAVKREGEPAQPATPPGIE